MDRECVCRILQLTCIAQAADAAATAVAEVAIDIVTAFEQIVQATVAGQLAHTAQRSDPLWCRIVKARVGN